MSIYLVLYHGANSVNNNLSDSFKRMKMEDDFSVFSREISNAVVDGGSPILSSQEINAEGPCQSTLNDRISRYLMIEAEDIDEAIELSKGSPLLQEGGRAEVLELSMASY